MFKLPEEQRQALFSTTAFPLYYKNYAGFWVKIMDISLEMLMEIIKSVEAKPEKESFWSLSPPANPPYPPLNHNLSRPIFD